MGGAKLIPSFTVAEIREHCDAKSTWVVIENVVYDVTEFVKRHPGGSSVLLRAAGGDATDKFHAFHGAPGSKPWKYLATYRIGVVENPEPVPKHVVAFRQLRDEVYASRLMDPSPSWFGLMLLQYVALWALGFALLYLLPSTWICVTIAALVHGFAYGQGGFFMHDLGHNSVFKDARKDALLNYFVMNFMLGTSPTWWRMRHNRHHDSPNDAGYDLDIRTLPLFAWDEEQFKSAWKTGMGHLRWQREYWTFLGPPLLVIFYRVANMPWAWSRGLYLEVALSCVYLVVNLAVGLPAMSYSVLLFLYWYVVVHAVAGTYLGWVFALNHTMFPIYRGSEERDWVLATTTTTQNVRGGWLVNYLTGHLSYQVEHHLFPRMPRHSYARVHTGLKRLLTKHGLVLHEQSVWTAVKQVYNVLDDAVVVPEPPTPPRQQ